MTNSEALKKMQSVKAYMTSGNPIWSVTEIGEAFDMAIEALEKTQQVTGKLNSDCISRKAAIGSVIAYNLEDEGDVASLVMILQNLPSAQPEHNPDDERKIADLHKIVNYLLSQPERKTGRITYTHHSEELWGQSAICISCGCKWQIAEKGEDNFCPNCGCELER